MEAIGQFFTVSLINPIVNILIAIFQILQFLHVPFALGFSIIILTVLIRFLLYPFTAAQLRTTQKMQAINPHLSKLKEKHKGDSQGLQQATMALYKEHGVNPAAGCLPALIQLPIIISLYSVFQHVIKLNPIELVQYINGIAYFPFLRLQQPWDTNFFGLPLDKNPSELLSSVGYLILLLPAVTALLQFFQSKMMFPPKPKEVKKSSDTAADFSQALQTQSLYMFPLILGYISYTFPLGLSLYWNTFTIFGMIQQYLLQKETPAVQEAIIVPTKKDKKHDRRK